MYPSVQQEAVKRIGKKSRRSEGNKKVGSSTSFLGRPQNEPSDEDLSWRKREDSQTINENESKASSNWHSEKKDPSSKKSKPKNDRRKNGKSGTKKKSENGERKMSSERNWRSGHGAEPGKNYCGEKEKVGSANAKSKRKAGVGYRLIKAAEEQRKLNVTREMPTELKAAVEPEIIDENGAKYKVMRFESGCVEDVIVTHFVNPNEIFVQPVSTERKFQLLMIDIQKHYSTKYPLEDCPKEGDLVAAKFKQDEIVYRATVIETNPLTVRYVDYGNEEVTEPDRLWRIDERFLELEAQSLKCKLPDLLPNGSDSWPEPDSEVNKLFKFQRYSCQFLNFKNNIYEVCLTISENGKNVRDELISSGFALEHITEHISEAVPKCKPFDFKLFLNETFQVYVSHVVDVWNFYVQIQLGNLDNIDEEIKKYIEKGKDELATETSVGSMCLVQFEGKWHRARVLETRRNQLSVQLVDHGNQLDLTDEEVMKIKHIPDSLTEYPPQAVECSIYCDSGEIGVRIQAEFKKCNKKYFLAVVKGISDDRLQLVLYHPNGNGVEFLQGLSDAPYSKSPVVNLPLVSQETLVLQSHIVSPKEIYIHRHSDLPALKALNSFMSRFHERNDGGKLEMGNESLCAVKSPADGMWRRARVSPKGSGSVEVFYIDYGRTESVPVENVKKLDLSLFCQHAFARKVSLNVDSDDEQLKEKLTELIGDKECVANFTKVGDILFAEFFVDNASVTDQIISDRVRKLDENMFRDINEALPLDAKVFISHINSPKEFWVHDETISMKLVEFQDELQTVCSNGFPKEDVQIGDILGALFSDQLWYRVKVIGINGKVLTVQFIDYGNSWDMDCSDVRGLRDDIIAVPVFARRCSLKGLWTEGTTTRLEEIISSHQDPFTLLELDGDVDLLQNGISVTEQLVKEGYLEENVVYLSHINSPNDFYVQQVSDKLKLGKLRDRLCEAESYESAVDVSGNTLYCAKYWEDNMWYRAKPLERKGGVISVLFVDYGNVCDITDVRMLPEDLQSVPPLAMNCSLLYGESNDDWSEPASDKLNEYLDVHAFKMDIVAKGVRRSFVKLYTDEGENMTEMLERLCEKDERVKVCVTHVNSLRDFFVQDVNDKNYETITSLLTEADTFKEIQEKRIGVQCAAKYVDGQWYRAVIRDLSDDGYEVFFVDFGNTHSSTGLKELPDVLRDLRPMARRCSLNLPYANIPESISDEFAALTNHGETVFRSRVVQSGDRDVISLMLEGRKLEDVLLYALPEDGSIASDFGCNKETEFLTEGVRIKNETDEEKIAVIPSTPNGFRSDDEKFLEKTLDLPASNGSHEVERGNETQDLFDVVNNLPPERCSLNPFVGTGTNSYEFQADDESLSGKIVPESIVNKLEMNINPGNDEEVSSPFGRLLSSKVPHKDKPVFEYASSWKILGQVEFDDKAISAAVNGIAN